MLIVSTSLPRSELGTSIVRQGQERFRHQEFLVVIIVRDRLLKLGLLTLLELKGKLEGEQYFALEGLSSEVEVGFVQLLSSLGSHHKECEGSEGLQFEAIT